MLKNKVTVITRSSYSMEYLLRGILIGILFGLPVGAIGALTVQRTWSLGAKAGLLTGLGSSVADCFYAFASAFGLTLISEFLLRFQGIITALGGILILAMGLKSLIHPQGELPPDEETLGGRNAFSLRLPLELPIRRPF